MQHLGSADLGTRHVVVSSLGQTAGNAAVQRAMAQRRKDAGQPKSTPKSAPYMKTGKYLTMTLEGKATNIPVLEEHFGPDTGTSVPTVEYTIPGGPIATKLRHAAEEFTQFDDVEIHFSYEGARGVTWDTTHFLDVGITKYQPESRSTKHRPFTFTVAYRAMEREWEREERNQRGSYGPGLYGRARFPLIGVPGSFFGG